MFPVFAIDGDDSDNDNGNSDNNKNIQHGDYSS